MLPGSGGHGAAQRKQECHECALHPCAPWRLRARSLDAADGGGAKRRIDRLRLALLVLDVGATPRPLIEFIALAARLVTFVLLIASAAFSGGWLAWLPSWLAILVAVLLIVVQLPFVDMIRFFRLFRRSSRAIMKTPGWLNERPE